MDNLARIHMKWSFTQLNVAWPFNRLLNWCVFSNVKYPPSLQQLMSPAHEADRILATREFI